MAESVIEIQSLSKKFKNFTAVDNLSLQVEKGEIFGFLGPNGAGKSTTIRMMLSLIEPNDGKILFFGEEMKRNNRKIFARIGALVEKPDFYLYLSAYHNLQFFGRLSGADTSKKSLLKTLDMVGLKDRAYSKVKTYSLGMKQRLGLAQALLHNPDLIILDEPTNGLDPQGMKDVKELLLHLANNEGKTIFISSHILREVETMATSMAIINAGKTVVQGKVNELLESDLNNVRIELTNLADIRATLKNSIWNQKLKESEYNLLFELKMHEIPDLVAYLSSIGAMIVSVIPSRSLEDYFLRITQGESNA